MKTSYSLGHWYRTFCVLMALLLGLAGRSQAQVYYLTSDANVSTATATDALNRVNFDGTGATALVSSIATIPNLLALDAAGNRAFVYEGLTASRGIKVYSSLNGTPVLDRTLPVPAAVAAIEYNAADDYVYFLTSDGAAGTLGAADALNRIKADGSGANQVLVASIASSPVYLALNIAGNRAYVYEGLTSSRGIKPVDLSTNTVGSTIAVAAAATALDYAPSNGYLYYLTTDGTNTSTGATDAIYRVPATGGTSSLVVASLTSFPAFMALDLANDRIYVAENFASTPRAFRVVRPSDGTVMATYAQAATFTAIEIKAAAASTTVTAINTASANPTNASTVSYTVTFGASITGLGISNFSLVTSGLSGGTITGVSGSGASYTVTVGTGSGSGTLRLNLANDTGLNPDISTTLPFAGQTYTIDKTAPTVVLSSSTAASGSTTSTTPFAFTATFSESVTGFAASDITTNGTVSGFAGSGTTYTFSVTPATGAATTVGIAAGATQDAATNANGASNTYSLTYALAPTVTTAAAASVGSTSALLGGNVTSDGGAMVTSRGIVYSLTSTNANPTIGGTGVTQDASGSGTGSYSKSILGLTSSSSYTVRAYATNSLGTSYGALVTFTTAAPLSTASVQTNIACNGAATGSASVTVSGGLAPYSYAWSPSVSTTATAANLSAGIYSVTVTDASGATTSRSFTITQPLALAAATSQNDVTTNGGTNGSATITVSGGTPGYTYSWSPSVSTTATAANLSAGTYSVTVTDGNSCTIARTFTITQPAATTAAPVVVSPANGALLATATPTYSGTAPAGSTVTVYVDGNLLGTTTATGGNFGLPQTTALAQGQHTVSATAQLSGQTVSGSSATNTFTVDTVAPTATLSTTAGSATSTSPIPFSVSFSELVTGFSASGIGVTNGTVTGSAVSGSGPYTFSITPTANGTVTVSIRANAAQDAAGNGNPASATLSVTYTAPVTATTWAGIISPDWFTAGNWTAGVPTATIDATIPNGTAFSPAIGSGTATTRSLTLNSGATLAMSGGTLDVRANLTSNGTFVPTGGTVILGTTAVSNGPNILGSSRVRFWNLTINASGVLLSTSAGASVRRLLTLSGAFVTQSNPFVLESDASGTALVVNSNSAGFVFGAATVQRYIDASGNAGINGYRHYSSPVAGATVSSLSTSNYGGSFTAQVNSAYNTADPNLLTLATYPNVFVYDESKIAASPAVSFSDFDKGYQSPASLSDPLTVGRGYAVQIGNAEKVQFTGSLNNNTQTIGGLTYAAAGTAGSASAGWALVGNPYPSPLDWRTVGTATGSSLNGVDGAAYVFQSTSAYNGRYKSFTNNVGAGTGLIASGQGFFVRASTPGTTGSITLTNANRVTSYASPAFQRTTAETRPLLRLSLGLGSQPATVATAQDETFVYFETSATDGYDGKYDAYKLANPSGYYLGSVTPGAAPLGLSIDGRAPLVTPTEIPLWVSVPAGTYTLTATELLNFATLAGGTTVQLRDALLGTFTDLATAPSYSFAVAVNQPYAGRFSLVFRPANVLATLPGTELAQSKTSLYPNPATSATALSVTGLPKAVTSLQVEVLDALGRAVVHYALPVRAGSANQPLTTDQLAGTLYLLRLTALDAQGQAQGILPTQRLVLTR